MTPDECVDEIRRLLECYPGVTVVSADHNATTQKSYIRMSITSLQSFARIIHHCQAGANVPLHVSTAGTSIPKGQPVDVGGFRYSLELRDDDGRGSFDDPPAPIQVFGIFLARDLRNLGLIDTERAGRLLEEWHGGC